MYVTFSELSGWIAGAFFVGLAVGAYGFYWLASRETKQG